MRIGPRTLVASVLLLVCSIGAQPLPDLVPVALDLPSVIQAPPNPTVQVIWGVTNQGNAEAAGYWADIFYLSSRSNLDSAANFLTSHSAPGPLDPGAAYWMTNQFTLPIIQSGFYYLILKANGYQSIMESNTNNNELAAGFSYEATPPDLTPLNLVVPSSVAGPPYPPMTIAWGVTNQGPGYAAGYWFDALYLSTNSTLDSSAVSLTTLYENGPVPVGGVYWRTNALRLPVTQSGTYYLFFITDEYNSLYESQTNNNLIVAALNFNIQRPDLAPIALELPTVITSPPNPQLTFVWGVTNQGTGVALGHSYWSDAIYFSTNPVWDSSATEVNTSSYETGPINAGDSYWRTNIVAVPITNSGTYYFFLKVDAFNMLLESNEENNQLMVPVSFIIQPPDLVPLVDQIPRAYTGTPNPHLSLVWGVTNQGSGAALGWSWGGWFDDIFFSTNSVLDNQATDIAGFLSGGPLAAGSSYWRTNDLRMPVTQSGRYYLIFVVDRQGYVYETNRLNNTAVVPIDFTILPPDLVPIGLQAPPVVTGPPNPSLTVVWGVTNQGIGPALMPGDSWWDIVYFSKDAVVDPFDAVLVSQSEPGPFNPGESYWHTNTVQLPIVSSTNGFLILKADGYDQLYELNKANNTLAIPLKVNILSPDLAPIAFLVPNTVTSPPRPSLTFIWGVTNQGAGVADPGLYSWTDSIYLSTTNVLDYSAQLLGQAYQSRPIPAGGSYWRTNVFPTSVLQSGTYYLFLVTDDSRTVYESDFGNNTIVAPVTFTIQPPDLAVLSFQAPAAITGPPRPAVTFVWGITNQGTGSALGNWMDSVYISSKPVYDYSASLVFSQFEYGPLDPGGTYWWTNGQNLPVTQSGTYYLFLETDYGNALAESDTTNNWASLPITVTILAPDLSPVALEVTNLVIGPPFPSVTFVWGVTNLGLGAAVSFSSWQDQLSLCATQASILNCNSFSESYEGGPIPPGGSYWRTNTYRVPVVASGTYGIRFDADVNQQLYESSFTNNELTVPVTFQIRPPDLAPIVFQAPRSVTGAPNPQVKLSWGVTNQGSGSAIGNPYWSDRIYFSTNSVVDFFASTLVGNSEYGPVTPGGNYWRSQTVTLPVTQSGSYYLIFVTDAGQVLYDANYSNNTVVVPITCNILAPDLAPFVFQAPTNISGLAITNVTFVWAVTNQGVGAADGSWCDSVFVSTDPQITWNAPLVCQSCRQGPLPPGGSYWITNSVSVPVTQSGNYYFIVSVDSGSSVTESIETNNSLVVPVSISAGLPDLAPVALQVLPAIVGPADPTLTLVYAITNQGGGLAFGQWLDQLYFSQTNILDGSEVALSGAYEQGPVLPGQSYWRTNTVQVPVVRSGLYYFLLKTDVSNYLPEANESNKVVAVPVTFTIQPSDVAAIDLQAPPLIIGPAYPQLTLSWGITNQGPAQARPSWAWYQMVFVSTVPIIDSNALEVLAMPVTNALPPGATLWFTNDIVLPLTTNGQYYLLVTVNANNGLAESNTNNDVAVVPLAYEQRLPDLAPIAFQVPETSTIPPYPWVTLTWGVINQGAGAASAQRPESWWWWQGFWFDRVWLSTSSNLDSSDVLVIERRETNSVAPGGSYWRSATVQLPITESGNYYLIFEANSDGIVMESDLSNNTVVVPLSVTVKAPDLTPFIFQAPGFVSGQPYPQITVVWGVTNQGSGPAEPPPSPPYASQGYVPPLVDALYLSPTPTLDYSAMYSSIAMWPRTTPVLPGTSYRQTNTVTVPVSGSGSYYLIFRTDAFQSVVESDESNNSAVLPITFQLSPPADLTALAFIVPRTITGPGNPQVTVAWHVINQGLGPATGQWWDFINFWTVPSPTVALRSFPITGPLPVGADYWVTNTFILPVSQSGDYQLNLYVGGGGFFDLDTQDNSLTVPITVNITGPPAILLSNAQFLDGAFSVLAYGAVGDYYTLQASVDFTNWSRVLDFVCTQVPTTLFDFQAGEFASRFYRIAPMTNSPMLRLDIGAPRVWTSNGLLLRLDGPVGAQYDIEASSDLLAWQKVTSFSTSVTPKYFVDPSAFGYAQRFSRAVLIGQ